MIELTFYSFLLLVILLFVTTFFLDKNGSAYFYSWLVFTLIPVAIILLCLYLLLYPSIGSGPDAGLGALAGIIFIIIPSIFLSISLIIIQFTRTPPELDSLLRLYTNSNVGIIYILIFTLIIIPLSTYIIFTILNRQPSNKYQAIKSPYANQSLVYVGGKKDLRIVTMEADEKEGVYNNLKEGVYMLPYSSSKNRYPIIKEMEYGDIIKIEKVTNTTYYHTHSGERAFITRYEPYEEYEAWAVFTPKNGKDIRFKVKMDDLLRLRNQNSELRQFNTSDPVFPSLDSYYFFQPVSILFRDNRLPLNIDEHSEKAEISNSKEEKHDLPKSKHSISVNVEDNIKKDISLIIKDLKSKDFKTRLTAIKLLQKSDSLNSDIVPDLINIIKTDKNETMIENAIATLSFIGRDAKEAVPILIEAIKSSSRGLKINAITALGKIGPDAKEAESEIINIINSGTSETLIISIRSWRRINKALDDKTVIKTIIKKLTFASSDSLFRKQAIDLLLEIDPQVKTVTPEIIKIINNDTNRSLTMPAVKMLAELGNNSDVSVLPLANILTNNRDNLIRDIALESLINYGHKAKKAKPYYLKVLNEEKNISDRLRVIKALVSLPHDNDIILTLIKIFKNDPSKTIRLESLKSLEIIGEKAKTAIPLLLNTFKNDKDRQIIHQSLNALNSIDPLGRKQLLPSVIYALKNNRIGHYEATVFLRSAGTDAKEAAPLIIEELKSPSGEWKQFADNWVYIIETLGQIDPDSRKQFIKPLLEFIKGHRYSIKKIAIALSKIGPDIKEVAPELLKILIEGPWYNHLVVIDLVQQIAVDNREIVKLLVPYLKSHSNSLRLKSIEILSVIAIDEKYVSIFKESLTDQKANIRSKAIQALGRIGSNKKEIIEDLYWIRDNDPDFEVRHLAKEALNRIQRAIEPKISLKRVGGS